MPHTDLSSPPRRRGITETDLLQLYDWVGDLFIAVKKEAQLLDPAFAPIAVVELTISDDEMEATHTFDTEREDADYTVLVQAKSIVDSGDLFGAAAFTVKTKALSTTGFTVTFCDSPGEDNSITFEAFVFAT